MKRLTVTLRRSLIGSTRVQRACVATLGLRKIGQSVVRPDDARTAGLLRKVRHLVEAVPEGEARSREGSGADGARRPGVAESKKRPSRTQSGAPPPDMD